VVLVAALCSGMYGITGSTQYDVAIPPFLQYIYKYVYYYICFNNTVLCTSTKKKTKNIFDIVINTAVYCYIYTNTKEELMINQNSHILR
jgi:hypothetical protein